jgi:hypothetical protein
VGLLRLERSPVVSRRDTATTRHPLADERPGSVSTLRVTGDTTRRRRGSDKVNIHRRSEEGNEPIEYDTFLGRILALLHDLKKIYDDPLQMDLSQYISPHP